MPTLRQRGMELCQPGHRKNDDSHPISMSGDLQPSTDIRKVVHVPTSGFFTWPPAGSEVPSLFSIRTSQRSPPWLESEAPGLVSRRMSTSSYEPDRPCTALRAPRAVWIIGREEGEKGGRPPRMGGSFFEKTEDGLVLFGISSELLATSGHLFWSARDSKGCHDRLSTRSLDAPDPWCFAPGTSPTRGFLLQFDPLFSFKAL